MSVDSFPSFWKADHDFTGDKSGAQLSFKKGETFLILEKHDGGWFTAERNMERGYVPGNYFTKIEVNTPAIPPVPKPRRATTNQQVANRILPHHASTSVLETKNAEQRQQQNLQKMVVSGGINNNTAPVRSRTLTTGNTPTERNSVNTLKVKPPFPVIAPTVFKPNQSAAPPIPLRTDLGESDQIPEKEELNETSLTDSNSGMKINTDLLKAGNYELTIIIQKKHNKFKFFLYYL